MMTTYTGQVGPLDERFTRLLRTTLRNLYDTSALRSSPLVAFFGLAQESDPPAALRQLLIGAIRELQPKSDTPTDTQMWRVYEVLFYRYVQRSTQVEVADQLGISVRHLSRLEHDALEVLARRLPGPREGEESPPLDAEVAWLATVDPRETVDLGVALASALDLVRPLAEQNSCGLRLLGDELGSSPMAVHHVALRQILLSLLSMAVRSAVHGEVVIMVEERDTLQYVSLRVSPQGITAQPASGSADATEGLEVVRGLVEASGGRLTVRAEGQALLATVALPAVRQAPVLVIDDNPATLQLLRRYASGTRYRVTGVPNLAQALALAPEFQPRLVVLDVMMPDMDGWEALGRLRQHPLTSHIPVIICTILPEEELALSLGASGFVRKPVSREAFLQALDRADRAAPVSA